MNHVQDHGWSRNLPEVISNQAELDEVLSRPSPALVESIKDLKSPLLILGAGGKMGPTIAWMARRAAEAAGHSLRIVAVSRFTDSGARAWLEARGIDTWAGDLLEPAAVAQLPESANVLYLVGLKFGTTQNPAATWAMNTIVPARVAERFPHARLVALSTGNVYSLTEVARGGAQESDPLRPLGEYANAAVGRERVLEFYARRQGNPLALLRLFYAVELRYGVLVDIAQKVNAGAPVELANGYFNCIWQRDANDLILRAFSLAATPPSVWNLCGPESFSLRAVATTFGELLGRSPQFAGVEAPTALLGDAARLCARLGRPPTPMDAVVRWIAHWVKTGGRNLGRPTHFEVRDGAY